MTDWNQLSLSRLHQLTMGTAYGMTNIGSVRLNNEDNFLIDDALDLVMVADGMGGHDGGEIASRDALLAIRAHVRSALAIGDDDAGDTLADDRTNQRRPLPIQQDPDATWSEETMPAVFTLFDAVEFANQQIFLQNCARKNVDGLGMGTTLTGFWKPVANGPLVIFHVGDTRLYRYRPGELAVLTRDHTLYQQAIEAGVVDNLPPRNLLLQAIGPYPSVKADIKTQFIRPGDLLLLCSDGLHGSVPDADIEDVLQSGDLDDLEEVCRRLIRLAMEYGSRDNISVVLTRCTPL